MASRKTLLRTAKVLSRVSEIFGSEIKPPFGTAFDMKTGKIITKWKGSGSLVETRRKGPGTMERIYKELPRETLLCFVIPSPPGAPAIEPSRKQWEDFQRRVLVAARRITIRQAREQFNSRLKRLSKPAKKERGRPRLKADRLELVAKTIQKSLERGQCKTKTEAVRKAAEAFGRLDQPLHTDTIWRYLRILKQAT